MTNRELISIANGMNLINSKGFLEKKLPVKLLYAIKKNAKALTDAYKPYQETMEALCSSYGVDPSKYVGGENSELDNSLNELLDSEADVKIHTVQESVIMECGEGNFDPITMAELTILEYMIEEEQNHEN